MEISLTNKIKNDYGTVKRFCFINNININTFKQISYGIAKSKRITDILVKHNYIKNAEELKKITI